MAAYGAGLQFAALATMPQVNELGGQGRKGEKATPVVFWRIYVDGEVKAGEPEPEIQEAKGQGRRRFVLRYYSIFNAEQCELPTTVTDKLALPEPRQHDPIEACETILCWDALPARNRACRRQSVLFADERTASPCHRADYLKAPRNTGRHSGTKPGMQVGTETDSTASQSTKRRRSDPLYIPSKR